MRKMFLRHVDTVGFRASELTNYEALIKRVPSAAELGPNDVVLFISAGGNQLLFVHGFRYFTREGTSFEYLRSERLRLRHFAGPRARGVKPGTTRAASRAVWDPLMVGDYANAVGIKLIGLKRWEDHKRALIERLKYTLAEADRQDQQRPRRGRAHTKTPSRKTA